MSVTPAAVQLITDLEVGLQVKLQPVEPVPPVRPPGAAQGALPCVQLTLADMPNLIEGQVIEHRYTVNVLVPRDDAVTQCALLEHLTEVTLEVLLESGYGITGGIRALGGEAEDVHHIGRGITVASRHRLVCA